MNVLADLCRSCNITTRRSCEVLQLLGWLPSAWRRLPHRGLQAVPGEHLLSAPNLQPEDLGALLQHQVGAPIVVRLWWPNTSPLHVDVGGSIRSWCGSSLGVGALGHRNDGWRCTWLNLATGMAIFSTVVVGCLVTLGRLQVHTPCTRPPRQLQGQARQSVRPPAAAWPTAQCGRARARAGRPPSSGKLAPGVGGPQ